MDRQPDLPLQGPKTETHCHGFSLQNYLTLLDDEDHTLEYLNIQDEQHLIIEGGFKGGHKRTGVVSSAEGPMAP